MTLRDTMARHARTALTRADHFGEVVSYKAVGADTPTDVVAVVNRLDVEPTMPGAPKSVRLVAVLVIPRGQDGITAVSPGDTVTLALRLGATPTEARVRRIISQDEGAFEVEVAG